MSVACASCGAAMASSDPACPAGDMRYFRYSDLRIRPSSHTTIDATVSLP